MNPYFYDRIDLRRRGIKLANSTLLRLEAKGAFPARLRLGKTVMWSSEEVDQHIEKMRHARGGEA
jgi:prophage regulatory protein